MLIHRSAERVPVTQIRMYVAQRAASGVSVGSHKYRMHKTVKLDLASQSLKAKMFTAGAKMMHGDPGFKMVSELTQQELFECAEEECTSHPLPMDNLCYIHSQQRCSTCKRDIATDDNATCSRVCNENYKSFAPKSAYRV